MFLLSFLIVLASWTLCSPALLNVALLASRALSDVDGDGQLSCEEFVLALYLCEVTKAGAALPAVLPAKLIPPSQRRQSRSGSVVSGGSGAGPGSGPAAAGTPTEGMRGLLEGRLLGGAMTATGRPTSMNIAPFGGNAGAPLPEFGAPPLFAASQPAAPPLGGNSNASSSNAAAAAAALPLGPLSRTCCLFLCFMIWL